MFINSEYQRNALKFLRETETKMHTTYLGQMKYFPEDKESRDVYQIVLINAKHVYAFRFGDSLKNTVENRNGIKRIPPSAYDVLACITKSEPPKNVDEFAEEYGYTKPSIALRTFKAVNEEWNEIQKLFTVEQIEKLQEIN